MAMAMVVTVMLVWSWAMMCEEWYVDIFSPDQNLGNFGRCHTIIYRCAAFWHRIHFPHKGSLDVLHPNRFQQSISLSRSNNGGWVEICVLIDCLHPCLHPGCTVVSRDNMHPWYAPLICTPGKDGLQKIQDHKEEGQRKSVQECIVVWGCTWVTLVSFVHYLRCNACEIGS